MKQTDKRTDNKKNKKTSSNSSKKAIRNFVRVCPKCASTNLKSELYSASSPESVNFSGFECSDCGYYGMCPEIDVDKLKEFRDNLFGSGSNKKEKKTTK